MKRLIPAIALLLTIIAICIASNKTTKHICNDFKDKLSILNASYKNGNFMSAQQKALEFKEKWKNSEETLILFLNHNPISEISMLVSNLEVYAKEQNDVLFKSTCSSIYSLLEQIIKEESFCAATLY